MSFRLDEFSNLHQLIDSLAKTLLGFGKGLGVHVFGSIDVNEPKVQRRGRQSNAAKEGKQEPACDKYNTSE